MYHTGMNSTDPLVEPMVADEHKNIGGVQVDVALAGNVRVKRMIYPVGFSWAANLSGLMGSRLCPHAHVGFMARGD